MSAIRQTKIIKIDLTGVKRVDASFVQLLILSQVEAKRFEVELEVNGHSDIVNELATDIFCHVALTETDNRIVNGEGVMSVNDNVTNIKKLRNSSNSGHWYISLQPEINAFRNGFKPQLMFEQLAELGNIVSAKLLTDNIPTLDRYDPEGCYLGWELILNSSANKNRIADVFKSLEGANLSILPPKSLISSYQDRLEKLPGNDEALGQMLSEIGALTSTELQQALNHQKQFGGLTGDILIEQGAVQHEVINSAIEKQQNINAKKQHELEFVKVNSEKLNRLVTLVGDMVIHVAKVSKLSSSNEDEELIESTEEMALTLKDIRETSSCLSMVPISNVFNRIVQDVSIELNKKIKFEIIGEETELDRTVIEKIIEPLKHLVHNAIEYGFIPSDGCLKKGKIKEPVVTLKAYKDTGVVVIEVIDDGNGLDPEELLRVAKKRGLVNFDQSLYEYEIYNLIFEPGFSTANSMGDCNCRGVGLDSVRRNIESLRGSVVVNSNRGEGVTITIRLPLNLAIIDGAHLRIADESFILPLDMLVENIELNSEQVSEINLHGYIHLNDTVLPVIKMDEYIGAESKNKVPPGFNLVVVEFEQQKIGLLVQELKGETQAVIKQIGGTGHGANGFVGFTILDSGQLALILDVPSLIKSTLLSQTESNLDKLYASYK